MILAYALTALVIIPLCALWAGLAWYTWKLAKPLFSLSTWRGERSVD